jgi:L-rhamnose mutarotase
MTPHQVGAMRLENTPWLARFGLTPPFDWDFLEFMQRICFLLKVKTDRLDEYKARHKEVWPEMLAALSETGWKNYSLFLRDDGLLVGYCETPDFEAALRGMAERDVNARWQKEMGEFFEALDGKRPDEGILKLQEVFHLD